MFLALSSILSIALSSCIVCVVAQATERIITDLTLIESEIGVPIDYSYNETRHNFGYSPYSYDGNSNEDLISSPGCPKSIDGLPWVYVTKAGSKRCYLLSYQGPCEYYERVLLVTRESTSGICACNCFLNNLPNEPLETSVDRRFSFCTYGGFVYDAKDETCYQFTKQGPCPDGKVLIRLTNSTELKCVDEYKGQCDIFYNLETGKCEQEPTGWNSVGVGAGGAGGFGGSVGQVLPNDCLDTEKYSHVLRKCLEKKNSQMFIIG